MTPNADYGTRRAGDQRDRCERGHLACESCGQCQSRVCDPDGIGDWRGRVTTDSLGRTLCRECRYDKDVLW
jgi:hypothetical protein